jgi:hypothetical protein
MARCKGGSPVPGLIFPDTNLGQDRAREKELEMPKEWESCEDALVAPAEVTR